MALKVSSFKLIQRLSSIAGWVALVAFVLFIGKGIADVEENKAAGASTSTTSTGGSSGGGG